MRTARELRRDGLMHLSRRLNRPLARPDWVSVNVTLRCNLKCTMCTTCYDAPELSTDEIKGIVDQTAAWGVEVFNPLGGEPFMRGDIEEILSYAVRRGFYVTVTTNGTLITRKRAGAIAGVPSDRLHFNISLDGARESHDKVRGQGMWARSIQGYQRIREADAQAGNARRKVLANSILHAGNLDHFEAVLEEQAELGFDGVQILNLFRAGPDAPPEAAGLWFRDHHMARLEALSERLAQRVEAQGPSGYQVQNTPEELRSIPRYYREELSPLEAPCWAGWKELYINADGKAIMCDGKLDFLAGEFGDARTQTLSELWSSPELQARREVVKQCSTPCVQKCYLRPSSDSAAAILQDGARIAARSAADRLRRLSPTVQALPEAVLRLELSDVCECDWEGCSTPSSRWRSMARDLPERPTAETWGRLRDKGHLDFGRGFMGFEVVRGLVDDLTAARLLPGTLALRWRGEPLLHPEVAPILRFLLDHIGQGRVAQRLRVETSGRFLTAELADQAGRDVAQDWVLDLDRGDGAGLELLQRHRGPQTRIVLAVAATPGQDLTRARRLAGDLPVVLGAFPTEGDALWVRRTDHGHFLANKAARERLRALGEALGQAAEAGEEDRPRRCRAPERSPTISWDGKLTLCPWDLQLDNRVGDITSDRLSALWFGPEVERDRTRCATAGVPDRALCRDCGFPWSPNHD